MRRLRIFGVVFAMLVLSLCLPVGAQSTVITQIDFSNVNAVAEENLSLSGYGDKDSGYATATEGGRIYASVSGTDLRKLEWSKGEYGSQGLQPVMTGGTKNPWGHGAYWEVRVSTRGYEHITFSAQIGATNKGPRDYKLQYSTDGKTYTDVAGQTFTVTANKTLFEAFEDVVLPTEAADCAMLYIRVAVASNMLVNGTAGLIGSTGGETAINHIAVCGTPLSVSTTSSSATTTTTVSAAAVDTTTAQTSVTVTVNAGSETLPNVNTGEESTRYIPTAAMVVGIGISALCASMRRKRTV